jgi:hypothetical protein
LPEIKNMVDRLHAEGVLRHGVEAAVNLVLGKRGGTVADPAELDEATAELVRASEAHVKAAGLDFDAALNEAEGRR